MADRDFSKEFDELKKDLKTLQKDLQSAIKSGGKATLQSVESKIEDHPIASVVTVFGVGFVLGWLMGRK